MRIFVVVSAIFVLLSVPAAYAFVPAIAAIVGSTSYTSLGTMLLTVGAALASFAFSFYADGYTEENPTPKELNVVVQPYQSAPGWSGAPSGTVADDGLFNYSAGSCRYNHRAICISGCTSADNFDIDKGAINCAATIPSDFLETSGTNYRRMQIYTKRCVSSCGSFNDTSRVRQAGIDIYQSAINAKDSETPNNALSIRQNESGFYFNTTDSDYLEHQNQPEYPRVTEDGQLVLQYSTPQGPATTVVTRNNSTNTTDYLESVQTSVGQISQTSVSVGGTSGSVQTATQTQIQGDLAPVPEAQAGVIPTFSPVIAPTSPTDPETQPQTQFPTDYARQGEASAAAVQITTTLLQGDVVTPTVDDAEMPWFGATFDGLSPSLAVSSTCPVVSFGQTRYGSFDSSPFCDMLEPQQGFLFAIFTAVWTLLGFRVVMSA